MKSSSPKLLAIAGAIAALALGVSGQAQASATGLAYQDITNGTLLFSDFQNATGGVLSGGTNSSTTSSDLTGFVAAGDSVTKPRGVLADAAAACVGGGVGFICGVNQFTTSNVVNGVTGNYARADAAVLSEQLAIGQSFSAANIAESRVDGTGVAGSTGGNGSTTGFFLTFAVTGLPGGTADFNFSFNNNPYMSVFLDSEGLSATANITAVLTLTNNGTGAQLRWAPDGDLTGFANAALGLGSGTITETDPFSLNAGLSRLIPGSQVFDPTGGGFAGGPGATWVLNIDNLPVGVYSINLEMEERSRVSNANPEPGTLALVGLALLALPLARRRFF